MVIGWQCSNKSSYASAVKKLFSDKNGKDQEMEVKRGRRSQMGRRGRKEAKGWKRGEAVERGRGV